MKPFAVKVVDGPTEPMQKRQGCNGLDWARKKPTTISRKGFIHWRILAPRPGLEPGTYGLTVGPEPKSTGNYNKSQLIFEEFITEPMLP